uniref:Uncharacterized protein n=1 Tax=Borely moumouvirus TaxID=2712067 RepID=A0A6G6ACD1_9VIRU
MKKIFKNIPEKIEIISICTIKQYDKYYEKDKKLELLMIGSDHNNEIKSSLCQSDTEYE